MISHELIKAIRAGFLLDWQGIHGAPHWGRVLDNGLRLAETTGARVEVVELFAFFHDLGLIEWAYRRSLGTSARQLPPLKSTR